MREAQLRLIPSAIARFLDLCFPSDDTCEKEIGMRVVDPEQPSVVLLPQTNGFPTILNDLVGNLGNGPLRLL